SRPGGTRTHLAMAVRREPVSAQRTMKKKLGPGVMAAIAQITATVSRKSGIIVRTIEKVGRSGRQRIGRSRSRSCAPALSAAIIAEWRTFRYPDAKNSQA